MEAKELMLTREEYDELITVFMPSEDMRTFLKESEQIKEIHLQQLIIGSPISLDVKLEMLRNLTTKEKESGATLGIVPHARVSYWHLYEEMRLAFEAFNTPGIFTLEDCWYDVDIHEEKNELCGSFDMARLAKKYIKRCMEEDFDDEYDGTSPTWWTLCKWERQKNDMPKLLYKFYLVGYEVYWFERADGLHFGKELGIRLGSSRPFLDSTNLWLPVPYKEGDAIEINTFPFGPKQPAFITDIDGDWIDVVLKNHKGEWIEGGIVHCLLGRSIYQNDYVSPLYWIRKWPSDKKINGGKLYV